MINLIKIVTTNFAIKDIYKRLDNYYGKLI